MSQIWVGFPVGLRLLITFAYPLAEIRRKCWWTADRKTDHVKDIKKTNPTAVEWLLARAKLSTKGVIKKHASQHEIF